MDNFNNQSKLSNPVSEYWNDPHQAVELEAGVIGAMILESQRAIPQVMQIVSEDSFFEEKYRKLFVAITGLWYRSGKVDILTLSNHLQKQGMLSQLGGTAAIARLTQIVGTGLNAEFHARIIQQTYLARELKKVSERIASIAIDKYADVADQIKESNRLMDEFNAKCVGRSSAKHLGEVIERALQQAEKRQKIAKEGGTVGLSTGIAELDKILCGLQPLLYILAARPSMGKTAFMIHIAKMAAMQGKCVCLYSLEMSDISLANRFIISIADINADNFRSGNLSSSDWQRLNYAKSELNGLNIYIDDNAAVTMNYIASHSQAMKNQGKCDIILVDYLQFIDTPREDRSGTRNEEVGKISKKAKQISKSLNIPFILLSQLSRDCEKRLDKHPQLSDLRESGNLEQDADVVMFLYRAAYYKQESIETKDYGLVSTSGLLEVMVEKQRDGAVGTIPIRHNRTMTNFQDWTPQSTSIAAKTYSVNETTITHPGAFNGYQPDKAVPFDNYL